MNIVVVKYPTGIILHTHMMGTFIKKKLNGINNNENLLEGSVRIQFSTKNELKSLG